MRVSLSAIIVEDNDDDVIFLQRYLSKTGYQVISTVVTDRATFEDALQNSQLDVIFCDSNVPGFDAEMVVSVCKELQVKTPLILVSGGLVGASKQVTSYAFGCVSKDRLKDLGAILEQIGLS